MNIKGEFKICIRAFLLLLLCTVLGLALLVGVYMIPTDTIRANVSKSMPQLSRETTSFSIMQGIPGTKQDNFTEAQYLNEAMVSSKEVGHLGGALGGYTFNAGEQKPLENLNKVIANGFQDGVYPHYVRFWNGYLTVLKPILTVTDYFGVRQINLLSMGLLFLWLCSLMDKRGLKKYILGASLAILSIHPVTVAMSMTFYGFFLCTIIPCIIILRWNEWLLKGRHYAYFFELVGICAFFFNMNYFQIITFGIPLALMFLVNGMPQTKQMLRQTLMYFIAWLTGFAGMMVIKWLLYALVYDPDIFRTIFENILFRVSDDDGAYPRGKALKMNLKEFAQNSWWAYTELAFLLTGMIRWLSAKERRKLCVTDWLFPLLMLLFPTVRCLIFANHVSIHYWVTYRVFAMFIMALNLSLTGLWAKEGCGKNVLSI